MIFPLREGPARHGASTLANRICRRGIIKERGGPQGMVEIVDCIFAPFTRRVDHHIFYGLV